MTKTSLNQLYSESTGDPRLFLQDEEGILRFVRIDANTLELLPAVGSQPRVLRAKLPPSPTPSSFNLVINTKPKLTSLEQVFILPLYKEILVIRNGVIQTEGEDYKMTKDVNATTITFNANIIQLGDLIRFHCYSW